ncbi:TonB-dependent receptor domain-containing protein [Thalassotalea hakodatensis]|uniref:TonB-dependent receptor domain-containing protein n=1 Tax=Thalassotalea hakodatensis TaxID=3030492 RepID=UPI002574326D|nr:TonB-dependent receptor [Thalassotalea hakodatensis]
MKQKKAKSNHRLSHLSLCLVAALAPQLTHSQEVSTQEASDKDLEQITVVGTQIRGGAISEALAVSVLNAEDIENLGIDSGDELMSMIPENGQNFFSEAENIAGGINSARGDVGAFNLRNMGTGNTLVLLNGRRLVNSASYQTEEVGGSFVPVNSVNSNVIPVVGLKQVEVLRDGASAIYGADAVAGVVNHVLKSNFEGLTIRAKGLEYDNFSRGSRKITIEAGKNFNDGKTNVSTFLNFYDRDRISSQDDSRWSNSDFRDRIPESSPWFGDTRFRNNSINSNYGQFDIVPNNEGDLDDNNLVDSSGEFEVYPIGDPRCEGGYQLNATTCAAEDGQGTYRYNLNEDRDLRSDLQRYNAFIFVNHEFDNNVESFTELSYYKSKTSMNRHPSAAFSSSKLRVSAQNYYNPFGVLGSENRLPESIAGDFPEEGFDLIMDYYRFAEVPRIVDNDGETYRFLQGFRGMLGDWDWESAVSYSKAEKEDITRNRISNTLIQEALNDPTEAAYNPFSGGVNSNIERALIDVTRLSETELTTFDIKFSNADLFELPAGMVAFVAGFEWREESFKDDRDDRLDGTINFTDWEGDTYPYVSDVVNSSPTPDNEGKRQVSSLFTEFQIPVLDNLDVQAALRYEDFDDIDESTTVGKVAFGWRPLEQFLVRGSWSEAFRAPNLVTVNEEIVSRTNSRTDWVCQYAADFGGDPEEETLDCTNSIQRTAEGSDKLSPEKSENTSLGFVWTPTSNFTVTLDYWQIEKKDTIGLFGEENHTLLDLVYHLNAGDGNCESAAFNSAIERQELDVDEEVYFQNAGICPAGAIKYVNDQYANLDKRTIKGHDLGVYYNIDTKYGTFDIKYNGAFLDKYEQDAGGLAKVLVEANASGLLPASYPVDGFADLIGKDGNQDERHSAKFRWYNEQWGVSLNMFKIGSFYQSSLTLDDGTKYIIPSMTKYNASVDYKFSFKGLDSRVRFGVNNLTDERAPLADRYFGYFSDAHNDYGRSFYAELRTSF